LSDNSKPELLDKVIVETVLSCCALHPVKTIIIAATGKATGKYNLYLSFIFLDFF
jgi:hypothetical protein